MFCIFPNKRINIGFSILIIKVVSELSSELLTWVDYDRT